MAVHIRPMDPIQIHRNRNSLHHKITRRRRVGLKKSTHITEANEKKTTGPKLF